MRKLKPLTRYAAGRKASRKPTFPILETPLNTSATHAIRPFISPPTREQLMAGSASVRRVYKIEA